MFFDKKILLVLLLVAVVFVSGCVDYAGPTYNSEEECKTQCKDPNKYCKYASVMLGGQTTSKWICEDKTYHPKPEHQQELSKGAETIKNLQPGESQIEEFRLPSAAEIIYNIKKRSTYEVSVQATSSVPISYQQKYGPPQLDYQNTKDGKTRFSGGPEMVGGDVQEVAITIGPAPIDLTGLINVTRID